MKEKAKTNKKLTRNNIKNNENAITLVALVVTIIVLIILAGISISLVLGDNGIITKAKDARSNFIRSANEEQTGLDNLYAEMNEKISGTSNPGGAGGGAGGNTITAGETATGGNKNYTDRTDTAIIPKGFTVSGISTEQTIANGLVIYDLEGTDTSSWDENYWNTNKDTIQSTYNQYVWVPVSGSLARYEGYYNGSLASMLSTCSEPLNYSSTTAAEWETIEYTAMKNSVESNHGFYIARYEASKGNDGTKDKAESKKGKEVWNNVRWGDSMTEVGTLGAVYNSQQVYNNSDYNVTSTLIYGSEWDAVLAWIDSKFITGECTSDSIIVDSTEYGNYSPASNNYGSPGKTGIFAIKNIYDIAGNVRELTMEAYDTGNRICRGGYFWVGGSVNPISERMNNHPMSTGSTIGFRVALYL